jgi:hypothetical protein
MSECVARRTILEGGDQRGLGERWVGDVDVVSSLLAA